MSGDLMDVKSPHGSINVQCSARSKQSGQQCKRYATPGRNVCYIHGGKTRQGIAHPSFKTGRYVKTIPRPLIQSFDEAVQDEELMTLRSEVALVDALVADRLTRLSSGESAARWQATAEAWGKFDAARSRAQVDTKDAHARVAMSMALTQLQKAVEEGVTEQEAWTEIRSLLEQRRRMVESETKRLDKLEQYMAVEEAMGFARALFQAVIEVEDDNDKRRAIQERFLLLTGRPLPTSGEEVKT